MEEHPEIWLVGVSLFSVGTSSNLQMEALIFALSALSASKTLIILYVLPTFSSTLNADDYHYSLQRHLSRCNKLGFIYWCHYSPHAFSLFSLQYPQLSRFLLGRFVPKIYLFYLAGQFCPGCRVTAKTGHIRTVAGTVEIQRP